MTLLEFCVELLSSYFFSSSTAGPSENADIFFFAKLETLIELSLALLDCAFFELMRKKWMRFSKSVG